MPEGADFPRSRPHLDAVGGVERFRRPESGDGTGDAFRVEDGSERIDAHVITGIEKPLSHVRGETTA